MAPGAAPGPKPKFDDRAAGRTELISHRQVVPVPAVGGDLERVHAMIAGAEARLDAAKAEVARITSSRWPASGGDDAPASGGGGGDPAHWHAGFEAAPPADWQDRSAPCVICPLVLFLR